jgi:glycerophosphoryl diester phosphodiesterase
MGAELGGPHGASPVLIVAHRGECFIAPENTMASFELAWKNHDPAIELDIHLTADGKVVVCHDADTFRTSGNKERVAMKVATLAEIQKVDIGSFRGPQYAGQKCPTLDEVYAGMPDGTQCFTEIKSGIDVTPAFVEVFERSGKKADQVVVISFHADALEASKKALPQLKHYLLGNYKQDAKTGQWLEHPNIDDFIEQALEIGADGADMAGQPPMDGAACKKVLEAGLELHVWSTAATTRPDTSIDDPKIAEQYVKWGAISLTVNRAQWISEQLEKSKEARVGHAG